VRPLRSQSAVVSTSYWDEWPVSPTVVYAKLEVGPPVRHVILIKPSRCAPPPSVWMLKKTVTLASVLGALPAVYVSVVPATGPATSAAG
jgi:hypothetical protein